MDWLWSKIDEAESRQTKPNHHNNEPKLSANIELNKTEGTKKFAQMSTDQMKQDNTKKQSAVLTSFSRCYCVASDNTDWLEGKIHMQRNAKAAMAAILNDFQCEKKRKRPKKATRKYLFHSFDFLLKKFGVIASKLTNFFEWMLFICPVGIADVILQLLICDGTEFAYSTIFC